MLKRLILAALLLHRFIGVRYVYVKAEPDRRNTAGNARGRKAPLCMGLATMIVLASVMIAGLFWAYGEFLRISAVPTPPPPQGEAHLFFDRPGVVASLAARVEASDSGAKIEYRISSEDRTTNEGIEFFLVLTGGAQYIDTYPNGSPLPQESDCPPLGAYVISEVERYSCSEIDLAESNPRFAAPDGRAHVIRGVLKTNDEGYTWSSVTTQTYATVTSSAGKRTYFSLPAIGATYLPRQSEGRKIAFDVGIGARLFVPRQLNVAVDYGAVPINSRIESIAPNPIEGGYFYWYEEDAGLVRGQGSTVDVIIEETAQRALFLLGLYAGFVGGVLPTMLPVTFRIFRKLVSKAESD